jgi:aminoglycoside 6'-N-acetyltransferase
MPEALPTLHGERVTLRPMTEADLPPLATMLSEPGVREWWFAPTVPKLREWMFGDEDARPFAIELDGTLIGLIVYYEEDDPEYRHATVDLSLGSAWLGQGLGTDALRTVARYLFEERGHHRITIDPAVDNERAVAAYRKVGFEPVGVLREYERRPDGTWRDGLLMDLLKRELR